MGLIIASDNLKSITLFPNHVITSQNVVDHLGIPDYIQVLPSFTSSCRIGLVWINKQITMELADLPSTMVCEDIRTGIGIDPNLKIDTIYYVIPNDISLTTIPDAGSDFGWPGFVVP